MKLCKYCGAKIEWNANADRWYELEMEDIHYCPKATGKKPVGDSDNAAISKMLDARTAVEVLKPSKERDQLSKLSQDLYSLDNEFQDYKRKTDKRISEMEDRIKKLCGD